MSNDVWVSQRIDPLLLVGYLYAVGIAVRLALAIALRRLCRERR